MAKGERSVSGTVVFALCALAHAAAPLSAAMALLDYYAFSWLVFTAQALQVAVLVFLVVALFHPFLKVGMRLFVAALCFAEVLVCYVAFAWGYHDMDTEQLMALSLVVVDVIPAIGLCVPPDSSWARLAPFYGSPGEDHSGDINDVAPPP